MPFFRVVICVSGLSCYVVLPPNIIPSFWDAAVIQAIKIKLGNSANPSGIYLLWLRKTPSLRPESARICIPVAELWAQNNAKSPSDLAVEAWFYKLQLATAGGK